MKKKSRKILGISLTSLSAVLTVGLTVGTIIALQYKSVISIKLDQPTSKIENVDSDEKVEDVYKSEFSNSRKLVREESKYAETIQSEGSVLLINKDHALPATTAKNITLFGTGAVDFLYGGSGAGSISTLGIPTLKEAFENLDYSVNSSVWDLYATGKGASYRRNASSRGYTVGEAPVSIFTDDVKNTFSSYNDLAIVVISRTGREGGDLALTTTEDPAKHSLQLSQNEIDTITLAKNSGFKKVVVLLNTLNARELNELETIGVDACLWVGAGGQKGINAIPKRIKGDLVPSGRLVDTYAKDALSAPARQNFGDYTFSNEGLGRNQNHYIQYSEGIYVGYRYYETRYEDKVLNQGHAGTYTYQDEVEYPFGYGLSYTTFSYEGFSVKETENTFDFTVTVKNTGGLASKDVVEIYRQSPYTDYDKDNGVEKSAVELVGFEKTNVIDPNSSEKVTVSVKKSERASYDYTKAKTYIVDDGSYYFALGDNAHDALNNILAKKGKTTSDGMDKNGNASYVHEYVQKEFDSTTYATASNGNAITNQFDFANLKKYDSSVTYLTRSNWDGTFPVPYEETKGSRKAVAPDALVRDLAVPTIEDDQSYTRPTFSTVSELGELSLAARNKRSYDDEYWDILLNQRSKEDRYTLVRTGGYSTAAIPSIGKPGTIDKDGSAGISSTLVGGKGAFGYPVESVISSTWNKEIAKRVGELIGEDGLYTKTSGWYAPSRNIHRTQFSGRNFEYFSEDGYLSGIFGAERVKGAESKGRYCYVKHFAFNDQETNRGGVSTFLNEQAAREIYLEPFEITTEEAHPHARMAARNRVGTKWVGHSKELRTNVLRDEWGFEGRVITDQASFPTDYIADLRPTLYAGVDRRLCTNTDLWKIDGYENSARYCSLLRKATKNILYAVANSNAINGVAAKSRIVHIRPAWEKWLITLDAVVGVLVVAGVVYSIFLFKKKDPEEQK